MYVCVCVCVKSLQERGQFSCIQLNYHCIIHSLVYNVLTNVFMGKGCRVWFSACMSGSGSAFDTHILCKKGFNLAIIHFFREL